MLKYRFYKILRSLHLISQKKYQTKTSKYTREYKVIARSRYFDANWYLKHNPDIQKAGFDPIAHYLTTGWKENRPHTSHFNAEKYLEAHPNIKVNPLLHWERTQQKGKAGTNEFIISKKTPLFGWALKTIKLIALYPLDTYQEYLQLRKEFENSNK